MRPNDGRLTLLETRMGRIDAARGKPCGKSFIASTYRCHKEKDPKQGTTSAPVLSQAADGGILLDGRPPEKQIGKGFFGDTYLFPLAGGGKAVVKVDRLSNRDPRDENPNPSPEQRIESRRLMVENEVASAKMAGELGISPKVVSGMQTMPDGRFAFAYEYTPGTPFQETHHSYEPTADAQRILGKPENMQRFLHGATEISRKLGDSGLTHDDFHGANLLIQADGTPKLLDWGMSSRGPKGNYYQEASMLYMLAGFVGDRTGMEKNGGRFGKLISEDADEARKRIYEGERASKDFITDLRAERFLALPKIPSEQFRQAVTKANAIHKANKGKPGWTYNDAQAEVGLDGKITATDREEADKRRDDVYGRRGHQAFRRKVDQQLKQLDQV
jgi:hypothetical protein